MRLWDVLLQAVVKRLCNVHPWFKNKNGSTVQYVSTGRYASIFAKNHGTRVLYALLVKVRVRYFGTLFECTY